MNCALLFVLCLVALATAASSSLRFSSSNDGRLKFHSSKQQLEEDWKNFKVKYDKTYKDAYEERYRKEIFVEHLQEIKVHNRLYSQGFKSFTMGINRFSDLNKAEFVKRMTGSKPRNSSDTSRSSKFFSAKVGASIADGVDWRDEGYVTDVKYQGECGSCWAFSTTGALEGQHFRQTGDLVSLSEQQLVDCSTENQGCNGGWPFKALDYIASNGGIDTDDSYPYEAAGGQCRYDSSTIGATCTGYVMVDQSESALQEAVASIGPISVAIDASQGSFQSYSSGVYDDPACGSETNHAVLIVGYGTTGDGQDYWIVKNSWGTQWGMDGYTWMSRNNDNQCGIANEATYPDV
jgi:cathepsin L